MSNSNNINNLQVSGKPGVVPFNNAYNYYLKEAGNAAKPLNERVDKMWAVLVAILIFLGVSMILAAAGLVILPFLVGAAASYFGTKKWVHWKYGDNSFSSRELAAAQQAAKIKQLYQDMVVGRYFNVDDLRTFDGKYDGPLEIGALEVQVGLSLETQLQNSQIIHNPRMVVLPKGHEFHADHVVTVNGKNILLCVTRIDDDGLLLNSLSSGDGKYELDYCNIIGGMSGASVDVAEHFSQAFDGDISGIVFYHDGTRPIKVDGQQVDEFNAMQPYWIKSYYLPFDDSATSVPVKYPSVICDKESVVGVIEILAEQGQVARRPALDYMNRKFSMGDDATGQTSIVEDKQLTM